MNMNKKLRELMQLKAEKVTMAENAINNKETELANSLMEEIKGYTEEINQIQNLISLKHDDKVVDLHEESKEETGLVAVKNYIKSGIVNAAGPLKESEGENGGYLVPEDVRTAINEYRRSFVSLKNYVDVRSVVVPSGSEVYEKTSQLTGLTNITELGEIQEMNAEVFEKITYAVKNFGGILPVSRFLLQDSPENLLAYLGKWFMKKQVVTENKEIIAVLKTLTKKAITKVDEIKEAFPNSAGLLFEAIAVNDRAVYASDDEVIGEDDRELMLNFNESVSKEYAEGRNLPCRIFDKYIRVIY